MENVDYIKIKDKLNNDIIYYLNYTCFEKLCMNGNTPQANKIRDYFVKIRQLIYIIIQNYLINH